MKKELSLINVDDFKSNDYKLITFFLGSIFDESSLLRSEKKTDEKINAEIYKKIMGDYSLDERNLGYVLTKIIDINNKSGEFGKSFTVSEMAESSECASNKVSRLIHAMVEKGFLTRTVVKGVAYFRPLNEFNQLLADYCNRINEYINAYNKMPSKIAEEIGECFIEEVNKIDEIVTSLTKKNKVSDKEQKDIKDKKLLMDYLKNIVDVESDIYSLKERYIELNNEKIDYFEKELIGTCYGVCLEYKLKDESEEIEEKPVLEEFLNNISLEKPEFNYVEPSKPSLKKPGLFNKSKVDQENAEIMSNYEKELNEYTQNKAKYEASMKEYEVEYEQLKDRATEQYKKALTEYEDKLERIKKNKEEKIKHLEDDIQKNINDNEKYKHFKSIQYEMDYLINCLEKAIKIREELYSFNIIYGKYRNIVAVSSFLDYFMSGRCETLDGSTGAYNLYEQESRTDIIINKMDIIIDKLDQIAENQFYIYNKICEVKDSLDVINGQLLVNNLLKVVEISKLDEIIDNTDKIAYNTEVSAYYSKKIAKYSEINAYINALSL